MEHSENERIEQRNIIFTKKDKLWKDKIGKAADEIKKNDKYEKDYKRANWKTIKAHKNDLKKKQLNRMGDRRKQMSHLVKEKEGWLNFSKIVSSTWNNVMINHMSQKKRFKRPNL